jgi:hypothetical protein
MKQKARPKRLDMKPFVLYPDVHRALRLESFDRGVTMTDLADEILRAKFWPTKKEKA